MDSIISSVTQTLVNKALDLSSAQQRIIANNIANSGSVGYSPIRLSFDSVMSEVRTMIESQSDAAQLEQAIQKIDTTDLPTVQDLSTKVMLDKEMVLMSENVIRFQSLITAKKGLGGLMKSAINGGKV
ncbi:flagellar basal body rod protein FlgB [Ketobacter alkanivorans]|uniref:Flagellar basal body rod protein FlgB n=1 Tax=Ketobacter alkanivorans TaxID=1917421 RepID=A0A2K9LNA8_9GAMM|nr:hypothetical protein [Ketobacter alkanivorans]AUM12965.1 hypothetical protein Kalk_11245 [Ketobacter alkanivorans]